MPVHPTPIEFGHTIALRFGRGVTALLATVVFSWLPAVADPPASVDIHPGDDTGHGVILMEDFESPEPLTRRWTSRGELTAVRRDVEPGEGPEALGLRILEITAARRAQLESLPLDVDFPRVAECRLWLRAPAAPVTLELHFLERTRPASFWRRIRLTDSNWHEVRVPLNACRWSAGAAPRWADVDRVALRFRGTRDRVDFGRLKLVDGGPDAATLRPAALRELAFGDDPVRQERIGPFTVLTDGPAHAIDALRAPLLQLADDLQRDLGAGPTDDAFVPLLIFNDPARYRAFWPRFGKRLDARLIPPATDGFTSHGVAGSACADGDCELRPVWIHEAVHAWAAAALWLDNHGDWLQEGLALRSQMRVSGQTLHEAARAMLNDARRRVPFARLVSGEAIALNAYPQAALVVEWLLHAPPPGRSLAGLTRELTNRASTDLRPISQERLGRSLEQLEQDWLAWLAEYAAP